MQIPYFDAHCDTVSRIARFPGRHLNQHTDQWDLNRMDAFTGPRAQFFAIFYDSALSGKHQAVKMQLSAFQRECRLLPDRIAHCTTAQAAEEAFQQGKLAAFLSVEGAELLDCSLEKLQWAYDQGVRAVNLTWNHANALSGSLSLIHI